MTKQGIAPKWLTIQCNILDRTLQRRSRDAVIRRWRRASISGKYICSWCSTFSDFVQISAERNWNYSVSLHSKCSILPRCLLGAYFVLKNLDKSCSGCSKCSILSKYQLNNFGNICSGMFQKFDLTKISTMQVYFLIWNQLYSHMIQNLDCNHRYVKRKYSVTNDLNNGTQRHIIASWISDNSLETLQHPVRLVMWLFEHE